MRKLIYAVLGLVLVLVVAVVVAVLFVDLNQYKGEIEAQLEAATGREVTLGGDIHVTFWPSIGAAVEKVEIANIPGGSSDPMLRAQSVQAVVAIAPLLSGEVKVESIRIVDPVLLVESLDDGTSNLVFSGDSDGGGASGTPSVGRGTDVQVDMIEIVGGTVIYRDRAEGRDERVENIGLTALARTLQGPFEVDGSATAHGIETGFAIDVGSLGRSTVPVSLRVVLGDETARLTFTGNLDSVETSPRAKGSLIVQADSLAAALAPIVPDLSPDMQTLFDENFELDAEVTASGDAVSLVDLALSLGALRATGDAAAELGEKITFDVALSANQLDGDRLIAAFAGDEIDPSADAADEANTESTEPNSPPEPEDGAMPAISASVDLNVDVVTYRDGGARQIHLIAMLNDGILSVQQLNAELPGGTNIAVVGELENHVGGPAFRGQVELASDNIRATLDWLQVSLPEIAAERMRRVDMFGSISVEPGVFAVVDMDLSVDSSRLTGAIGADWTGKPTVSANVSLDRINLDAYLTNQPALAAEDETGEAGASNDGPVVAGFVVPPLPDVNADIKARVGALTFNGVAIDGIVLDGALLDGRIDLRSLSADIADASVRAAGLIDPAATTVSLRYAIEAPNIGGLSRLLALELPVTPEELGAVSLVGSVEGDTVTADVKQRLETALGAASVDGIMSDPLGSPGFKGRVGLRSDSYMRLARGFGIDISGISDSVIAFAADVDTDGNDAEFNAVLEAIDATLRASGTLTGLTDTPGYNLRAKLQHDELTDLMRAVGMTQGGDPLGPVDVTITAEGDGKAISGHLVSSIVGPSTLNGTLDGKLDGARPYFNIRLVADTLALDPLMAAGSGGTVGDSDGGGSDSGGEASTEQADASRWSSEPIDLSLLRSIDGRAEISGDLITVQGLALANPTIAATIDDGVFQLEQFRGGLFDGQIDLTGQVTEGSPHKMNFDLIVSDADAQQVLQHFADTDEVTGRLYINGTINSAGASQRALVESLAGDSSLSMRDGVIEGFDLPKISERLDNLDNEVAVAALLDNSTSGGQTRFTEVEGTFVIEEGVAWSDDLRALMEAGAARFTMVADLPRWLIDLQGYMELTEHDNSPRILISVIGPIDNPERVIDSRELQAFLVQRAIETALRKYGGDEEGGAGQLLDILTGRENETTDDAEPAGTEAPGEDVEPQAETSAEPEPALEPEPEPEPEPQQQEQRPDDQPLNTETLLDILTEGQGDEAAGDEPSQEQPPEQQDGQPLNTETLLKDLLEGLGN